MKDSTTSVELKYQTDWAKIEVLTPGASIEKDPQVSASDYADITWANTSVLWQKEHSYKFTTGSVKFVIVNDGKPVDIKISRGRDGYKTNDHQGNIEVTFEGHTYKNVPSDWNASSGTAVKVFKDCPVNHVKPSPKPEVNKAWIAAGMPGENIAKYTLQWSWTNPRTGIPIPLTFNINSNDPFPSFKSPGAPNQSSLLVEFVPSKGQPYGLNQFSGSIGGGDIRIEIGEWDIIVTGKIEGGPPKLGLSFTGSGSWTTN